ncbi:MAG: hypothetical protein R6U57_13990 [Anaerolineales bacterium]
MRQTLILICGLLVILTLLVSTASPETYLVGQWEEDNTPSPTPKSTQNGANKPLHRQSGDTQWLKIGAAVIVLIILGGVLIQRGEDPSGTNP